MTDTHSGSHSNTDPAALLAAYDAQLRREGEVYPATSVTPLGPLLLATFGGSRGFITYRTLATDDGPATEESVRELVAGALAHYEARPEIRQIEWKTRGHDHAPGLHEALLAAGFEPDEPESVMVGDTTLLALDVDLPEGVTVRRVTDESDIREMGRVAGEIFGDDEETIETMTEEILTRVRNGEELELWVAEIDGRIVSSGRIEPVPGSDFAGVWGGSTLAEHRGRGIYRALTAARARAALSMGKRWINSDSTEFSRPILERSGLVKITTTTPYVWKSSGRRES